jgi:hypothetical protein
MRCHVCGAKMAAGVTALPFKVRDQTIVIVKRVPVQRLRVHLRLIIRLPGIDHSW